MLMQPPPPPPLLLLLVCARDCQQCLQAGLVLLAL
jgi:hypothetical protein